MARNKTGNSGSLGGQDCGSSWRQKYGQKHYPERIRSFPAGIAPPSHVRIYRRNNHYLIQWWEKSTKSTLSERIDGDLLSAMSRARLIDERLSHFRTSGHKSRRVGHQEMVDGYLTDLNRRADAGEVDPRTVQRYASAIRNHYLAYVLRPDIERQFGRVAAVNRDFQLGFRAFLANTSVRPNGHPNAKPRPMRGQKYVMDVVHSMLEWAIDPERGNLLPEGFRNPFIRRGRQGGVHIEQFGEPDITLQMASDFVSNCDAYQLRLFAPMVLYGFRASEPCFLFDEDLAGHWLKVPCRPELAYLPKGRREKRMPVIPCVQRLLESRKNDSKRGLLYIRRAVIQGGDNVPLLACSADGLAAEFYSQCNDKRVRTAGERRRIRDRLLKEAGAITYDNVVAEFRKLARRLNWPGNATLKDFRHLFATAMENAGMPEHYRKYLMGQSVGRAPIVTYTHLNEVRERYEDAVERSLHLLVSAIHCRHEELLATVSS